MAYEQLKLSNQICFPLYAVSRLITREYQPYLEALGITYPQYLVLMVLWEKDHQPVNDIAQKLVLNTNTVTPLLKRMETQGLLIRQRSEDDERKVLVHLTAQGSAMQHAAADIPQKLMESLAADTLSMDEMINLKNTLDQLVTYLSSKEKKE